jgi:hypothetical protein
MKLRKNDYLELRKGGLKAIDAKLLELATKQDETTMLKMKNELKNPREDSVTRRAMPPSKRFEQKY